MANRQSQEALFCEPLTLFPQWQHTDMQIAMEIQLKKVEMVEKNSRQGIEKLQEGRRPNKFVTKLSSEVCYDSRTRDVGCRTTRYLILDIGSSEQIQQESV